MKRYFWSAEVFYQGKVVVRANGVVECDVVELEELEKMVSEELKKDGIDYDTVWISCLSLL